MRVRPHMYATTGSLDKGQQEDTYEEVIRSYYLKSMELSVRAHLMLHDAARP